MNNKVTNPSGTTTFFQKRHNMLRWAGWFALGNAVCLWIVGIPYLQMLFPLEVRSTTQAGDVLVTLFIFVSYFSYFALIAAIPLFLTTFILHIISIRGALLIRYFVIIIATLLITLVFIDSFVFSLYRFHLNALIINMIVSSKAGIIFGFSSLEQLLGISIVILFFIINVALSYVVWRYIVLAHRGYGYGKYIALILGALLFCSYATYISSAAMGVNVFIQQAKAFPLYESVLATFIPFKGVKHYLENYGQGEFSQLKNVRQTVNYPLQNVNCPAKIDNKYNFIFIVIDGLRFDALSKETMPSLSQLADQSWRFSDHFSGGNSSQAGLFSLMYSLPPNYWTAMKEQGKSPLFTNLLRQHGYQLAAFTSKTMAIPAFNKTILLDMHTIADDLQGATSGERDQQLTQQALNFIQAKQQTNTPFFSFLFYDSGHSYCAPQTYPQRFQPAIKQCYRIGFSAKTDPKPYHNRYRNAIRFIDDEIKKLLTELKRSHLLDNTILVITGDHSQEFNDSQQDYWEHASNYTRFQVQTPLIVYWPGQSSRVYHHTTTHYDVIPTLIKNALKCPTPTADYSIGHDLLDKSPRPYVLAGSYINFAIIEPQQITTIYPSGTIERQNSMAQPLAKPNQANTQDYKQEQNIIEALALMRKFFKNS